MSRGRIATAFLVSGLIVFGASSAFAQSAPTGGDAADKQCPAADGKNVYLENQPHNADFTLGGRQYHNLWGKPCQDTEQKAVAASGICVLKDGAPKCQALQCAGTTCKLPSTNVTASGNGTQMSDADINKLINSQVNPDTSQQSGEAITKQIQDANQQSAINDAFTKGTTPISNISPSGASVNDYFNQLQDFSKQGLGPTGFQSGQSVVDNYFNNPPGDVSSLQADSKPQTIGDEFGGGDSSGSAANTGFDTGAGDSKTLSMDTTQPSPCSWGGFSFSGCASSVASELNPFSSANAKSPGAANDQTFDVTAYYPCSSASACPVQGGLESARPGLDGESMVRTLDDYRLGKSDYVTGASDPSRYGQTYEIPEVTYKSALDGKTYTLDNVPVYVHDTGGAFAGRPDKLDIAAGVANSESQAQQFASQQPFLSDRYQSFSNISGADLSARADAAIPAPAIQNLGSDASSPLGGGAVDDRTAQIANPPLPQANPLATVQDLPTGSWNPTFATSHDFTSSGGGLSGGVATVDTTFSGPDSGTPKYIDYASAIPTAEWIPNAQPSGEDITAEIQNQNIKDTLNSGTYDSPSNDALSADGAKAALAAQLDAGSTGAIDFSSYYDAAGVPKMTNAEIAAQIPSPDVQQLSGEEITQQIQAQNEKDATNQITEGQSNDAVRNDVADAQNPSAQQSSWLQSSWQSVKDWWNGSPSPAPETAPSTDSNSNLALDFPSNDALRPELAASPLDQKASDYVGTYQMGDASVKSDANGVTFTDSNGAETYVPREDLGNQTIGDIVAKAQVDETPTAAETQSLNEKQALNAITEGQSNDALRSDVAGSGNAGGPIDSKIPTPDTSQQSGEEITKQIQKANDQPSASEQTFIPQSSTIDKMQADAKRQFDAQTADIQKQIDTYNADHPGVADMCNEINSVGTQCAGYRNFQSQISAAETKQQTIAANYTAISDYKNGTAPLNADLQYTASNIEKGQGDLSQSWKQAADEQKAAAIAPFAAVKDSYDKGDYVETAKNAVSAAVQAPAAAVAYGASGVINDARTVAERIQYATGVDIGFNASPEDHTTCAAVGESECNQKAITSGMNLAGDLWVAKDLTQVGVSIAKDGAVAFREGLAVENETVSIAEQGLTNQANQTAGNGGSTVSNQQGGNLGSVVGSDAQSGGTAGNATGVSGNQSAPIRDAINDAPTIPAPAAADGGSIPVVDAARTNGPLPDVYIDAETGRLHVTIAPKTDPIVTSPETQIPTIKPGQLSDAQMNTILRDLPEPQIPTEAEINASLKPAPEKPVATNPVEAAAPEPIPTETGTTPARPVEAQPAEPTPARVEPSTEPTPRPTEAAAPEGSNASPSGIPGDATPVETNGAEIPAQIPPAAEPTPTFVDRVTQPISDFWSGTKNYFSDFFGGEAPAPITRIEPTIQSSAPTPTFETNPTPVSIGDARPISQISEGIPPSQGQIGLSGNAPTLNVAPGESAQAPSLANAAQNEAQIGRELQAYTKEQQQLQNIKNQIVADAPKPSSPQVQPQQDKGFIQNFLDRFTGKTEPVVPADTITPPQAENTFANTGSLTPAEQNGVTAAQASADSSSARALDTVPGYEYPTANASAAKPTIRVVDTPPEDAVEVAIKNPFGDTTVVTSDVSKVEAAYDSGGDVIRVQVSKADAAALDAMKNGGPAPDITVYPVRNPTYAAEINSGTAAPINQIVESQGGFFARTWNTIKEDWLGIGKNDVGSIADSQPGINSADWTGRGQFKDLGTSPAKSDAPEVTRTPTEPSTFNNSQPTVNSVTADVNSKTGTLGDAASPNGLTGVTPVEDASVQFAEQVNAAKPASQAEIDALTVKQSIPEGSPVKSIETIAAKEVSPEVVAGLKNATPPDGYAYLYRGINKQYSPSFPRDQFFSDSPVTAAQYAKSATDGQLIRIAVPKEDASILSSYSNVRSEISMGTRNLSGGSTFQYPGHWFTPADEIAAYEDRINQLLVKNGIIDESEVALAATKNGPESISSIDGAVAEGGTAETSSLPKSNPDNPAAPVGEVNPLPSGASADTAAGNAAKDVAAEGAAKTSVAQKALNAAGWTSGTLCGSPTKFTVCALVGLGVGGSLIHYDGIHIPGFAGLTTSPSTANPAIGTEKVPAGGVQPLTVGGVRTALGLPANVPAPAAPVVRTPQVIAPPANHGILGGLSGGVMQGIGQVLGQLLGKMFGGSGSSGGGSGSVPTVPPTTTPTTPTSPAKPVVTLIANPSKLSGFGTTTLVWAAVGPTACSITDPSGTQVGKGGQNSDPVNPVAIYLATTTQFTIGCTGGTGGATSTVTVTVQQNI